MQKKYWGFTLIEMLIVMGIMIILMAAGIAGGRFAIQRANRIQKQSAVRNLYQASMGYYTDNRQFPDAQNPRTMVESDDILGFYIDTGAFDGGVEGTFWYHVSGTNQEMLVCAQYTNDNEIGGTCAGNAFTDVDVCREDMPGGNADGEWMPCFNWLQGNAESALWDPDDPWSP